MRRWLLMCADLTESNTFELAQKYLPEMLGVPESTSAVIIGKLESDGLIRCNQSAIALVDRPGLETFACECYRIIRDHHE